MGAAASLRMLYKDALGWFKQYIDAETYMEDFKEMDRHNENALSFADVQHWITIKAKKDPGWSIFLTSGPVLSIAHKYACKHGDTHSNVSASKMVNITEFKTLLVHLFAFSILWSHFQNAEKWEESGSDVACNRLNFEAFRLAYRTFDSANAHEELSDQAIKADFELIDSNFSGHVGFIEVCNHCCYFIDDPQVDRRISSAIPKFFGEALGAGSDSLMTSLEEGPKTYFEVATIDQKNHEMVDALLVKLSNQKASLISASTLEHQNNIRKKYSNIVDMIANPLCCGFLLQFCVRQFCSEHLLFIREVDEFRDLFLVDTDLWVNDWKDTDATVCIDNEINEEELGSEIWVSLVSKEIVMNKIEEILKHYLRDDSRAQVCISKAFIERTLKRIKLLHLYGPSVFEEACIDPIITMNKDILPRYKVSDNVNTMVMRVASCEPPPPDTEFKTPPPDSLLLNLYTSEAFPDTRLFTLDEIIGNKDLYNAFLCYLTRFRLKSDLLLCIRRIDIYGELMYMNCLKEATDEAWQIYRYYVALNSAYCVTIPPLDRKKLMHTLAVPKKEMFAGVRKNAYILLKPIFEVFFRTCEYRALPKVMRDLRDKVDTENMYDNVCELPPIHRKSLTKVDSHSELSPGRVRGSVADTLMTAMHVRAVFSLQPKVKILIHSTIN